MYRIITIVTLFFYSLNVSSQSKIRFEEVKAINSLSQNTVSCIHQDKNGFLWLGTYNGLHRYDGYQFKKYKTTQNLTNSSSTDRISSLYEDRYGKLWVGTYDGRIHRFNPETETFQSFPLADTQQRTTQITNYYEAKDGHICLSTDNLGAYFIMEDSISNRLSIAHLYNDESNPNSISSNKVYFVIMDKYRNYWLGSANGLNRISLTDINNRQLVTDKFYVSAKNSTNENIEFTNAIVTRDKIWFSTKQNGLYCFDYNNNSFSDFPSSTIYQQLKTTNITALVAIDGNLWIGNASGTLIRYNIRENRFDSFKAKDIRIGNEFQSITPDNEGQLWIKTEKFGIIRFNPKNKTFTYYEVTPSSMHNLTDVERIAMLEDSKNNLWLAVQNVGLLHYNRDNDSFTTYSNDPDDPASLSSNVVECIYEDREGNIWIGTNWFGNGLNRMVKLDPAFNYIQPVPDANNLLQNIVRSLLVDSQGYIWAGTKNGQIFIYDGKYNLVHIIQKDARINYTGHNVYSIYEDDMGFIWLCTKGAGIFKSTKAVQSIYPDYGKLTFTSFKSNPLEGNSLNSSNIYDLIVDTNKRVWIASYGGGLIVLTENNKKNTIYHYTIKNSKISSDRIRDLFLDNDGRLWLGTTYGLDYIDIYDSIDLNNLNIEHLLADIADPNRLSYNDIMMIASDKMNNIWIATAGGGINKIYKSEDQQYHATRYNEKDGLGADNTMSILECSEGYLWVGTSSGISRYNSLTDHFDNFDHKNGLPVTLLSERTCALDSYGNIIFGSVKGFYVISPEKIKFETYIPNVCFTSFHLFNNEVVPGRENSPLSKAMPYTKEIILKHNQSNFAIEFTSLTFKSPSTNQYLCKLDGFENKWNYLGTENKAIYNNLPPGKYRFRVKSLTERSIENCREATLSIIVLKPYWRTGIAYFIYFLVSIILLYIIIKTTIHITHLKNNLIIEKKVAESKIKFFTNISHEFKTPLTLILGPIETIIKKTDLPTEIYEQLLLVHRNSKRLLRLISQILDFRRIQNDKVILNIQKIELISFLTQICENFQGLALQKNIQFDFIHDKQKTELWGDIQKLDIVFFNLLSNAFKFTPENKKIALIVNTNENIEIVIKDNGIGIESNKLPYIFDRFSVLHTEHNKEYYGSGIGLSLSYEYITLHKGNIQVESNLYEGTTFTVRFLKGNSHFPESSYVKNAEESNDSSETITNAPFDTILQENNNDVEPESQSSYSILIVEDDTDMLLYLQDLLIPFYNVIKAKNGKDGLNKAKKSLPDVIITDIIMPYLNGIELTQMLKEDISTSHIPIIMLTAKTEIENQIEGLGTGAEVYLAKPFTKEILLSYIKSILTQREHIKQRFQDTIELKPDEIKVTPRDKIFIEKLLNIINRSMSDSDFNVEKLAEKSNISRTVFNKKVKSLTGHTPVELIRLFRLKRAYQLLLTKEYNVTEVSYMVGFTDIRYFSTCFKKQFGTLPSDCLK